MPKAGTCQGRQLHIVLLNSCIKSVHQPFCPIKQHSLLVAALLPKSTCKFRGVRNTAPVTGSQIHTPKRKVQTSPSRILRSQKSTIFLPHYRRFGPKHHVALSQRAFSQSPLRFRQLLYILYVFNYLFLYTDFIKSSAGHLDGAATEIIKLDFGLILTFLTSAAFLKARAKGAALIAPPLPNEPRPPN